MEGAIAHNLFGTHRTSDVRLKEVAPFSQWLLKSSVKKGLEEAGFLLPTVIQASAIPVGKTGIDLLIQSKAGTGKTLIFCTVLLEHCCEEPGLSSLVLAPTREIAIQIESVLRRISCCCKSFQVVSAIGGTDVTVDRKRLQSAKAVVGTPGRLVHLIQSDILNTSKIKFVVLDEADQLYSSSHRKNLEIILNAIPAQRQILACSATFCGDLDVELAKVMKNPLLISTKNKITVLLGIKQFVYDLPDEKTSILEMEAKIKAMNDIFKRVPFKLCMVFAGSQSRAESYSNYLQNDGWDCELISGAQTQPKRNATFKKFRNFETRILVSTDLMARGIDSEHVNLVINVEPPRDMVTYLHRIGRAGRFGSHGIAITLISSSKDNTSFEKILSEIGSGLSVIKFPKDMKEGEAENFWDPSTFKVENKLSEAIETEDTSAILRSKDNLLPNIENKKNIRDVVSFGDSNISIDTQTFCIDSKDSAVNVLPSHIVENKENILLVQAEDTPTSNRSSAQLSANTIDDASSIAPDSIISTHQELTVPHPSLMEDVPKLSPYGNYVSEELKETKRYVVLQADMFMDYCANVLNAAEESSQKETEKEEDLILTVESNIEKILEQPIKKVRQPYDDFFTDYDNYIQGEGGDSDEKKSVEENKNIINDLEDISQEKNESLQVCVDSPVPTSSEDASNGVLEQSTTRNCVSDERVTDSQIFLEDTICASNGSYMADSEPSMESNENVNPCRKQLLSSEFYFDENISQQKLVHVAQSIPYFAKKSSDENNGIDTEEEETFANTNGNELLQENYDIKTDDDDDDEDEEEEEEEEKEESFIDSHDMENDEMSPINEIWMNEYWRQVNFIQAYVKFTLDYHKQLKSNE